MVGWENGILEVEFTRNGEVWQYPITEAAYSEMIESSSCGSFFMRQIRPYAIGIKVS